MPQLVAVITRDLPWVLLLSPFLVSDLGRVDSGGRGISGLPGIPLASVLFLLFVLFSLIGGRLGIGGSGRGSGGGTFTSAFIPTAYRSLGLDFVCVDVSGLVPS